MRTVEKKIHKQCGSQSLMQSPNQETGGFVTQKCIETEDSKEIDRKRVEVIWQMRSEQLLYILEQLMGLLDTDDENLKQKGCKRQVITGWAMTYGNAISMYVCYRVIHEEG